MFRALLSCRYVWLVIATGLLSACGTNGIVTASEKTKTQVGSVVEQAAPKVALPVSASTPGTATRADAEATKAHPPQVAFRSASPWVGRRTVAVQSDDTLPPIFGETFQFHFDDRTQGGRVSIAVVAERVSRMTGVPVRVKPDVYSAASSLTTSAVPATALPLTGPATPLPSGNPGVAAGSPFQPPVGAPLITGATQPARVRPNVPVVSATSAVPAANASAAIQDHNVDALQMRWDGTLTGFMNHLTGLLNLSWAYREGVVVIERLVTESFEITAFGGSQEYKVQLTGGNDGRSTFGSSSSVLDVQEQGKLAALESLKRSLDTLVSPSGGAVTLNEGSGRFIVMAPRDVMARVRELVRAEDTSLRRQAHIQFDVYSVIRKDSDEFGVDWTGFINTLSKSWGAKIQAPTSLVGTGAAGVSVAIASTTPGAAPSHAPDFVNRYGGSTALLQALHQVGDSAQYRPVSLVAMNRQWARKTNLKVTGYVAETTPGTTTGAGSGSPGLKTSTVTTGDKFLVQPAIMDDGTIFLKFGLSLTDLLGLFNVSAGSGSNLQTVQTPETSGTDDQGTIRLNPGESMVITGLSRRVAQSDRNALSEEAPVALGGSTRRSYRREDFLIVVRATPL